MKLPRILKLLEKKREENTLVKRLNDTGFKFTGLDNKGNEIYENDKVILYYSSSINKIVYRRRK